ncbi:sulfotransferase [Rhabdochromatium marinum]|uniref:sulfotransferase n=1 Tax=Rhabdochromatium marinum TaxID=48729 RepID=UPI001906A04C|nr:sulfotransferase [Rhabdochromatium marinum]MBK1650000.1 hypothetical protein [Rhabdochromatium marinum]
MESTSATHNDRHSTAAPAAAPPTHAAHVGLTPQDVQTRVLPFLAELVPEWEFEGWEEQINAETRLIADLGLTSVEFIDLFVAIEKTFGRTIGFHDLLMVEGRYIDDLRLGQLADFVCQRLEASPVSSTGSGTGAAAHPPDLAPGSPALASNRAAHRIDHSDIERFAAMIPQPHPSEPLAQRNPRAIFLLSAPRSGSTLLQAILAGHPMLFAPPELHLLWFKDLAERRAAFHHPENRHLTSGAIRALMALDGLSAGAASAQIQALESQQLPISDFYRLLQHRCSANQPGTRWLVDKTPAYAYSRPVLDRAEHLFEEPLYIHLVRHPGGMTRSFIDAKLERTVPFMQRHANSFSTEQFAELAWLTCNGNITACLAQIPAQRHYSLRYEDLVSAPEPTLRALCAWLGLDFQPAMLDPYAAPEARMLDGLQRVGEFSGDLKFHLHDRIEADAAWRWQRFDTGQWLSEASWQLADQLGYPRGG